MTIKELYKTSYELRLKAVEMVHNAKTGHAAPSLSMADIITTLYFQVMNIDPLNPKWENRDRFVLSKGHAAPMYYAALAKRGFFPEADLMEYRKLNSKLQGHPDMRKCPGVDMTTGSLGNGISAAVGMALIAKRTGKEHFVYALTGDGELQEGIVWEALMAAGNSGLDNLILIVDYNRLQSGGSVENIQNLEPLEGKFQSFGWNTFCVDGHDIPALEETISSAKETKGKPIALIAKTTKGKGVSYMENQYLWHMKAPNDEQMEQARIELEREIVKYE